MKAKIYAMIGAGLVLAALWLMPVGIANRFQSVLRDAFAPFMAGERYACNWRNVFDSGSRDAETSDLREQLAHATLENSKLRLLDRENRELRALLGLAQRMPHRLRAANILARDLNSWWQIARIDRGSRDGVQVDMPVMAPQGLAGRVIAVANRTADILLLIDPACRVGAMINRVNACGIVRGVGLDSRGMASCRMEFIPRDTDIRAGDEVLTSGLGGVYPAGLVIGYIRRVHPNPNGLYQTADIMTAADFRSLRLVFLVMDNL